MYGPGFTDEQRTVSKRATFGTIYGGGHCPPSFVHRFSWQDSEASLDNDRIWNSRRPVSAMNRSETYRRNVVRILVQRILVFDVASTLQFLHRLQHRVKLFDRTYPVRLHACMNGASGNLKPKCQRTRLDRTSP